MNAYESYRTAAPAARKRIMTAVVLKYRHHVAALVRAMEVPAKHREEAEQVGAIGLFSALSTHPVAGLTFEELAMAHAGRELQRWLDTASAWRKFAA